ncbi:MAG: hypothetical protein ACRC4N_14555, partial [Gammaproteobacteria bacterium]
MLLIILDAFHFDRQSLSKEIEAAKNKKAQGKARSGSMLAFRQALGLLSIMMRVRSFFFSPFFSFITEPVVVVEGDLEEDEMIDSAESELEEAMETNAADVISTTTDGTNAGESEASKPKEAKPKGALPVVSTGLPQSPEELESLISSIH